MLSVADLELALAASEGDLRNKVVRGELTPDQDLTIGSRRYFYFRKERKSEIAERVRSDAGDRRQHPRART